MQWNVIILRSRNITRYFFKEGLKPAHRCTPFRDFRDEIKNKNIQKLNTCIYLVSSGAERGLNGMSEDVTAVTIKLSNTC